MPPMGDIMEGWCIPMLNMLPGESKAREREEVGVPPTPPPRDVDCPKLGVTRAGSRT